MIKAFKAKMVFFLVLFLVAFTIFFAEKEIPAKIKELEQKLNKLAGREKVDALNDLANKYQGIDSQKSIDLGNFAIALSQKIDYKKGEAKALNNIGFSLITQGKYDQALEYNQKSLQIGEEIGAKRSIKTSLNNIGNIYYYLDKYDQALKYYQRSLEITEEIGEKSGITTSLNNISGVYDKLGKYDLALEFQQKSLKISEEIGDKSNISVSLNNIGLIYENLGKYDRALEYYRKSLKITEEIGDQIGISISSGNIGNIYLILHKFNEAEKYLLHSLKIAEEVKDLTSVSDGYKNLSELFESQGDFKKACEYFKSYFEVYKNIYNEKSNKQINELQAKYEAKKRESELLKAKKNEEVQKIKLQKQILLRNSFFVGFILTAIIFVLLFKKYLYFFAFWKKEKYIGRYRLLDIIGSGGVGVVYKAHSIKEKTEKVAVKILKQELSGDDSVVKRFKQEAVIIDKLDHANIVKVYERGEDKQRLYIVMEYLDGKTLAEKIAKESPIELSVCVHIMAQLVDALTQIHAHKIVHRDLKPSNVILLSRQGDAHFVKLLDFGLARTWVQSTLTKTGELLGTVAYMSPEQLLDADVTVASDIYSLGVIFYETVCGRRAFLAENNLQIIKRVLDEMPVEPVAIRPEIPLAMNSLVMKMLAKEPLRRPTLADFQEWLRRFLADSRLDQHK